ncbi:MAG: hypothetical protein Greene041679_212 [Parcubacteria group bacterium Greene0416_79]|nr:MAG: hypothetical protein Greene041679_212 [Parcubacteria group bacterium Greene0416_79]
MNDLSLRPKTTPKDFFLQLGIMAALYVSAISLINLLFQTINYAFPDKLAYYGDPYSSGIRWAIACLIIIFPLFLLLSRFSAKEFAREPLKRDLPIRRWLVYLTLFVAGIAVVVDLIALVNTFLSGEITVRFAFKVLTVLGVAGGVFGCFIYDLRNKERAARKDALFGWVALVAVVASIAWGFAIMGSPSAARERQFDDRRLGNLQSIQWQIISYWRQKEKLPATSADLEDSISGWRAPTDPKSDTAYEYKVTGERSFELCADFSRSTLGERERLAGRGEFGGSRTPLALPDYGSYGGKPTDNWEHPSGRHCFSRTIDPELYPPLPQKI